MRFEFRGCAHFVCRLSQFARFTQTAVCIYDIVCIRGTSSTCFVRMRNAPAFALQTMRERVRERERQRRAEETAEQRTKRLEKRRDYRKCKREVETVEQTEMREKLD